MLWPVQARSSHPALRAGPDRHNPAMSHAKPPLAPIPSHPHLVANYGRFDLRPVRGEGCWLIDGDGHRLLDGLAGIAVNSLGHGHPALVEAISSQAERLIHTSNYFHIGPQEELAALLCAGSFADKVFFCNSGAEANEAAYKLLRLWGNRVHGGHKTRILSATGSFHGRTMGALSLTCNPRHQDGFAPLLPIEYVPYGDSAALAATMDDRVAGVFLEPIQGESGINLPPDDYLPQVRALCDRHQALWVADEVQTGCGRCGQLFAHQWTPVHPDIMTLAKGLGGGVPIGAVAATAAVADLLIPGSHGSTFGGNHLACAAGAAVMRTISAPGFLDAINARGQQLHDGLHRICGDQAQDIRGRGLLWGVQLAKDPLPVVKAALGHGLICGTAGNNVLRLAPPLIISADEIDILLERLAAAFKDCAG